ncbi:hypothetical protein GQ53DRAFT_122459 [Thozetella sp. PMI_491]|nr:hypothetical protein GQ53DRAFT_122459 [Thozetella sp. PMI_491]
MSPHTHSSVLTIFYPIIIHSILAQDVLKRIDSNRREISLSSLSISSRMEAIAKGERLNAPAPNLIILLVAIIQGFCTSQITLIFKRSFRFHIKGYHPRLMLIINGREPCAHRFGGEQLAGCHCRGGNLGGGHFYGLVPEVLTPRQDLALLHKSRLRTNKYPIVMLCGEGLKT